VLPEPHGEDAILTGEDPRDHQATAQETTKDQGALEAPGEGEDQVENESQAEGEDQEEEHAEDESHQNRAATRERAHRIGGDHCRAGLAGPSAGLLRPGPVTVHGV